MAPTVVTATEFSATLTEAVVPPPFEVITGANSSCGVTVTAIACVSVSVPSLTCTVTSYTLLAPLSAGNSKFGADTKLSAPLEALIANLAASAPPTIE